MTRLNRRNILKATAVSGSGLAALAYSPKPTLAASDWTVNSPSQVSNESGELSSLEIPSSGFSFSLDYSGLGSGSHSINFELEAKLSSASSFESVFSDSFSVEGDSGTVTESKLSTSFPVDLLANTSMSASDFAEPNSGDTEATTVDFRVSFNWSEGENSASSSSTSQFDVNVNHAANPALTAKSLTVNDPPTVSNDSGSLSSLELPKDDFSFSLDYNSFETGTHSINFQLEAKLSSASSFESVFSESFDVSGENGTVSESKLSTSFPVDLLANTSMSSSDFEEPNSGDTEVTTVDFRVSFDWSGSEYSASDSTNDSFDVTVENTQSIPTDGLIAHYPFDTDASDATGNGHDATVYGATHVDTAGPQSDGAYQFDSNDDYIDTGLDSQLEGLSGITFSAWVRVDSYDDKNEIIGRRESTWSNYMRIAHDNKGNKFGFMMGVSGNHTEAAVDQSNFPTGTYHLLTGVFDNGELRFYKNDNFLTSASSGLSTTPSFSNNLWVGRIHGAGRTHDGIIDEVRIYDRALSESEITELYNGTS